MIHKKHSKRPASRRKGTATVELAVCLPTLFFTFMAAVQAADVIFLKQTLQVASYEAARSAIKRSATSDLARASGKQILTSRKTKKYDISFLPVDVSSVKRGELLSVTVEAPSNANTVLPKWMSFDRDMAVTTTMVKE